LKKKITNKISETNLNCYPLPATLLGLESSLPNNTTHDCSPMKFNQFSTAMERSYPVFRICIGLNTDPDPALEVNTDPDTDPDPSVVDPYILYTDPDPGLKKIYGSGSGSGSRAKNNIRIRIQAIL